MNQDRNGHFVQDDIRAKGSSFDVLAAGGTDTHLRW